MTLQPDNAQTRAVSPVAVETTSSASRSMRIAELSPDSAEELGLLLSRCLTHDEISVDLVRSKVFLDPAYQPRFTLGVRDEGRLVAAVVGVIQEHQTVQGIQRSAHIKVIGTAPEARRKGYATLLLDELERRFAAKRLTEVVVRGPVHHFWAGIDVRYSPALLLFERRGYSRQSDHFNLGVDLEGRDFSTADEEKSLGDDGIIIRRLEVGDRTAIDIYMQHWGDTWHTEVMESFTNTPISCHIALKDKQIVGFAALDIARPGWFGPTGTEQEMRGRGIGGILLKRCLADWQRAGRKYGEINWIGPLYFYVTSCDAHVSRVQWTMGKQLTAGEA